MNFHSQLQLKISATRGYVADDAYLGIPRGKGSVHPIVSRMYTGGCAATCTARYRTNTAQTPHRRRTDVRRMYASRGYRTDIAVRAYGGRTGDVRLDIVRISYGYHGTPPSVLPFDLTSDSELVVVLTSVTALASLGTIKQRNNPKKYIKIIPQKMLQLLFIQSSVLS